MRQRNANDVCFGGGEVDHSNVDEKALTLNMAAAAKALVAAAHEKAAAAAAAAAAASAAAVSAAALKMTAA